MTRYKAKGQSPMEILTAEQFGTIVVYALENIDEKLPVS